jgi:RNA polymerase sigma-70 factor (ECF subfamily)
LIEPDLIVSAQHGEAAAWEDLVAQHQEAVFRLAYLLLGDSDDAQDVAQEAFIRAYHALDRFDVSRPMRPWLLHIAANLARNRRRSVGRYVAALQRAFRAEPGQTTGRAGVEAITGQKMESERLWQAVQRLREPEQHVIYLRYFLELPEADMAAALDIAPGTVKSRLHRALKRLRAVIETDFPELDRAFRP